MPTRCSSASRVDRGERRTSSWRSSRARLSARRRSVSPDTLLTGTGRQPSACREREVGDDAEVVARPDAVYRFVEDPLACPDVEGRPVLDAAHHDVVDPAAQLERPVLVLGGYQRVGGGESVPRLPGMRAPPRVPVANARAVQGLKAAPEAHAGRVGGGVEVAGQHHVHIAPFDKLLDGPPGGYSLEL